MTLRLAMVSEHASPLATLGGVDAGGQNVHVAALALALGRSGVDVTIYTRRDAPDLDPVVRMSPNVVVEHVPAGPAAPIAKDELFPFMTQFAAFLHRRWQMERPDLVHAHFWMSGHASLAAAEPLDIPVVHTFHALGVVKRRHQGAKDTSPGARAPAEFDILRRANRVIATCTDEVGELVRLGGRRWQLAVVPCGVDVNFFRPDGASEHRTRRHRIVCVSRLVERKGIGNVIAALADVPDTELVVAGGPDRDGLHDDADARRLARLAKSYGVDDRVEFRGRVSRPDLPTLLRSADVVVCVPWYEPFGIVPLEAMACGKPVVVSAVGGLTDTVVHGVNGYHVPPRDPDRLAAMLCSLLADERKLVAFGTAGMQRARRQYSWERVALQTAAVYRGVLAAAVSRSREAQP